MAAHSRGDVVTRPGRRKGALALIVEAARSTLFYRPWLGALRRIWIGARS